MEQAPTIFERIEMRSEDQQRIAELERLVRQMTMQLEVAKKYREPGAWAKTGGRDAVETQLSGCDDL